MQGTLLGDIQTTHRQSNNFNPFSNPIPSTLLGENREYVAALQDDSGLGCSGQSGPQNSQTNQKFATNFNDPNDLVRLFSERYNFLDNRGENSRAPNTLSDQIFRLDDSPAPETNSFFNIPSTSNYVADRAALNPNVSNSRSLLENNYLFGNSSNVFGSSETENNLLRYLKSSVSNRLNVPETEDPLTSQDMFNFMQAKK